MIGTLSYLLFGKAHPGDTNTKARLVKSDQDEEKQKEHLKPSSSAEHLKHLSAQGVHPGHSVPTACSFGIVIYINLQYIWICAAHICQNVYC